MRTVGRFLPLLAVMATIFLLSHQPGNTLKLPNIIGADKLAHFTVYGLLALTAIYAIAPLSQHRNLRRASLLFSLCVLYGLSDEFHQAFIPFRDSSAWDLLADALGAGVVAFGWLFWKRKPDSL